MQIDFHRHYIKRWNKLTLREQERVTAAIELFLVNPTDPKLRLHQLKGKYYPQFSISAGGDLRAHFLQLTADSILFMLVGTHAQLYG